MTEEIYNVQDYNNLKEKLEKQKSKEDYKEEVILNFEKRKLNKTKFDYEDNKMERLYLGEEIWMG